MPYKYAGSLIRAGKSWTGSNGIKHPPNWMQWSDEEKAKAGLVWENDPKPFDGKFWQDADTPRKLDDTNQVDADGKAITDKNGKQLVTFGLKSIWKERTKQEAKSLLQPTDWKVIKASEVADYSMDKETADYRVAVRKASNDIEAKIDAVKTHSAFMALFDWPVDSDRKITGNAPIHDWPDEI